MWLGQRWGVKMGIRVEDSSVSFHFVWFLSAICTLPTQKIQSTLNKITIFILYWGDSPLVQDWVSYLLIHSTTIYCQPVSSASVGVAERRLQCASGVGYP